MATTTNNGWTTPDDTDLVKDGALAIRDLGQEIDTSVGEGLLAWQSYTPTFANFTLGNGTIQSAKYVQLGKTVTLQVQVQLGSTSAVTGAIGISLPVNAKTDFQSVQNVARLIAGAVSAQGAVYVASATEARVFAATAGGTYVGFTNPTATIPGTWASGSSFGFAMTYEAA
jgi:hypothetical protein